jgi:hypothetical protein
MQSAPPRWLMGWWPVVLIFGGIVLTAASDTAGNILILIGAIAQIGVVAMRWNYGVYGDRSRSAAAVMSVLLVALAVAFIVFSLGRLT